MTKREIVERVFRLPPVERDLLAKLPETVGTKDRYTALLSLVPVVERLEVPKVEERRAIKTKLPVELDAVLRQRAEETGQTMIDILLMAAAAAKEQAK